MAIEDRELRFSAIPQSDESFMGYILRVSEKNHYDTPSWLLQLARIKRFVRSRLSFVFDNQLDLTPLSKLTGIDSIELSHLLYLPANSVRKKMGEYLVLGEPVLQDVIRPHKPKICPCCLRETGYLRKLWEVALVTACPLHNCLLLDECPGCQSPVRWVRPGISRCKCGADWKESITSAVDDSELFISRQIYRLCGLNIGNVSVSATSSNPIYNLNLQGFISTMLFIAGQYEGRRITKGRHFIKSKCNAELHTLLSKAPPVFDNWPKNFFIFLDSRRPSKNKQSSRGDKNVRPARKCDFLYRSALDIQLAAPQFNFLRDGFREYIKMRRQESIIATAAVNNLSSVMEGEECSVELIGLELLGGNEASRFLGISWDECKWFIKSGKLKAVINNINGRPKYHIEKYSAEQLKQEMDVLLSQREVARALNIDQSRVHQLIRREVINPLRGRPVNGRRLWGFGRKEISTLLDRLFAKLVRVKASRGSQLISLERTLRFIGRARIDLGTLVQAILNDEIAPKGKDNTKAGLACLLFSRSDVVNFMHGELQLNIGDYLTVADITDRLKLESDAVIFLMRKGIIKAAVNQNLPALGMLVLREDLEAFNSKYVFAAKLASELQTTSFYLIRLLKSHNVNPVSGNDIDGGPMYVYYRSDVEQLDLPSLITTAKTDTRRHLEERRVISIEHAAQLLNISKEAVLGMVDRGVLKPLWNFTRSGERHNTLYFSIYMVEKYIDKVKPFENLVTAKVAALTLGISESNLNEYYVNKGRLKIVLRNGERGSYFRKGDVEKLIKAKDDLRQLAVSSSEAAELLGVNISCIHKWIESGLLKPISGPKVDGRHRNYYLHGDVEKLLIERTKFKIQRIEEGGTSRFGQPAGPNQSPVKSKIRSRIDQIVRDLGTHSPAKKVSGSEIHRRLVEEGHQVGINTVYECLRELRRQPDI